MGKNRVEKTTIPVAARVFAQTDYADSYRVLLPAGGPDDVLALTRIFMKVRLGWVVALLNLRNRVVPLLGIEAKKPPRKQRAELSFEPGTKVGIFQVFEHTNDKILMGEDDRHLNYRVLVTIDEVNGARWGIFSTVVHYNNWRGRLYFTPVKPFHRLVVPSMLRNMEIN